VISTAANRESKANAKQHAADTWLPNVGETPLAVFRAGSLHGSAGAAGYAFNGHPGSKTNAELSALNKKFGTSAVGNFVKIFPFVVSDSLKIAKQKGVALPSTPDPSPNNGEALAGALWAAGQTGHDFNVEVMLDRAVSHPIHVHVMLDIDAKYGLAEDADLSRRPQSSDARLGQRLQLLSSVGPGCCSPLAA
jgi:hypothetical protein